MKALKTILCILLVVTGLGILIGGEITVIAYCIYDILDMVKSDSVSFGACVSLVVTRIIGSLCVALIGILCVSAGVVIGGVVK